MNLRTWVTDPEHRITLHTYAAWIWLVLTLLTTAAAMRWPEHPWLLAWIITMSGYANVVGHWSAREGAAPSAQEGG